MDILYLASENIAGVPISLVQCFRKMGHTAHLVSAYQYYLKYPTDILFADPRVTPNQIQSLANAADVIITHSLNSRSVRMKKGRHGGVYAFSIPPKTPIIRIGHGSIERNGRTPIDQGFDAHFVTTPDIVGRKYTMNARWLPAAINSSKPRYAFVKEFPKKPVYISHSPTRAGLKGTKYFMAAIKRLKKEGYNVKPLLITRMNNQQSLQKRRKAAIHFDQCVLGVYGISAVEGLLLGQHVLVGITPHYESVIRKRYHSLPFHIVHKNNVYNPLKKILDSLGSPKLERSRRVGRQWAINVHDGTNIGKQILSAAKTSIKPAIRNSRHRRSRSRNSRAKTTPNTRHSRPTPKPKTNRKSRQKTKTRKSKPQVQRHTPVTTTVKAPPVNDRKHMPKANKQTVSKNSRALRSYRKPYSK
jgi:hypothetical protein